MEVTFTKLPRRRYEMTVLRERGPVLAPRAGPGYHEYLPHDAVHFLVEAEARLIGGVFGRIAAGHSNIFWPADPALLRRQRRRDKAHKPTPGEHADMATSENLTGVCQVLWEIRAGQRAAPPEWFSRLDAETLESPLVQRILDRLDEFAARWHHLPAYGSITLAWDAATRADPRRGDSAAGVGAAEAQRRMLTGAEVAAIITAEVAERRAAATGYDESGYADRAARLRREAEVIEAARVR
jgi:hypothetical protein